MALITQITHTYDMLIILEVRIKRVVWAKKELEIQQTLYQLQCLYWYHLYKICPFSEIFSKLQSQGT